MFVFLNSPSNVALIIEHLSASKERAKHLFFARRNHLFEVWDGRRYGFLGLWFFIRLRYRAIAWKCFGNRGLWGGFSLRSRRRRHAGVWWHNGGWTGQK